MRGLGREERWERSVEGKGEDEDSREVERPEEEFVVTPAG